MNTQLDELTARLGRMEQELLQSRGGLRRTTRRARLTGGLALAALVGAGLLTARPTVLAQAPGVTLASLLARIQADEATITSQGSALATLQSQVNGLKSQEQADVQSLQKQEQADVQSAQKQEQTDVSSLRSQEQRDVSGLSDIQQADEAHIEAAQNSIFALQQKTAPMTTAPVYAVNKGGNVLIGYTVTFSDANVQVVNGRGTTETQNGFGNLIVGYDEQRGDDTDVRSGSHNIVTGIYNNFGSSGGILGGYGNSLSDVEEFAVGADNAVSGNQSTITAGIGNSVTADYASVSGGENNLAAGRGASVSGGIANHANSQDAAVSGGFHNAANGINATVTGGLFNAAVGDNSSVSGGSGVVAASGYTPVTDGGGNITGGRYVPGSNAFTWVGAGLASH